MKIEKSGIISKAETDGAEIEKINNFAIEPLKETEVFTFKVMACGNDIDREGEAFTAAALYKLAELFTGKTVMQDHDPRTENQVARIYKAEVIELDGAAQTGENRAALLMYCYMVQTDSNRDLICEIKAGIKKEVSVSCGVEKVVCSTCGADNRKKWCEHVAGREYSGAKCYKRLEDPTDAYELSFVAVPAQKEAGVTKEYGGIKPAADDSPQSVFSRMKSIYSNNKK